MKLNFWQWLGAVLLVLGIAYYIYGHYLRTPETVPSSVPASATSPATAPAT